MKCEFKGRCQCMARYLVTWKSMPECRLRLCEKHFVQVVMRPFCEVEPISEAA